MTQRLITVFGGAGFVGRYVVRQLASKGWRIKVVSRSPGLCGHLQPLGDVGQIVVQPTDLSDEKALSALLAESEAAVNLIGILYENAKQSFDDVQGELPGRIARAAATAGLRHLVHVSAIGADAEATSAYARSKASGEQAVRAGFEQAVIIRPSLIIGPEDEFFNRFAAMARLSPVLPLIGGGETRFQPVYVGDVAASVLAALERPEAAGAVFEVGGPKVYSFAELLRYMLQVIDRKRLLVNLPFNLALLEARFLELMPKPLLTRDQVELLRHDNIVGDDARTLSDLGISPTPIEVIVPDYLARHRASPARVAQP